MMIDLELQATACRRLNIGAGEYPMLYWTNLDADPNLPADIHATVPPIPFGDETLDEIYAGHFLEHLEPAEAREFLRECYRCLTPGGKVGIVVPDTFEVMRRYVLGMPDKVEFPHDVWRAVADLNEVCALFLYSYVQDSPHRWSYDKRTLRQAIEGAGFEVIGEIDRYNDPRVPVGAWYQFGFDARKPKGE